IAQLAASARDWDEMLRIVIERTTRAMRAEVSSLYLLERAEGVLRLVATNGLNRRSIGRATLRVGEGITGWVANARVPLAARDVRTDPRFKWIPGVDEERFVSMLSVPVVAREEVIGVMNVQTVEPREFHREEIDFLQTIANQVAGITEKGLLRRGDGRRGGVGLQVPGYAEFREEEVSFVGALANQAALAIDKASLYALERKTTESLRELERARSDFVAVVTHDLRTPLSVIRGYLDLFAEKNGKTALPVSEATAQVARLDQLVDRILAGVRTDRPELSLRRARFDLRATVAAALKEVALMARRHRLTAPRGGQPVVVRGDRRRTAAVVAGLVHHATKSPPTGPRSAG